jgi:hypothetical protein
VCEVGDRREVLEHVVGVVAPQHRVVPEAVRDSVDATGGIVILVAVADRHDRVRVQRDRDLGCAGDRGTQGIDRETVREQQVVARRDRGGRVDATGRVDARAVAEHRRAPRFVDRRPTRHAITERVADDTRVVGEPQGGLS